MELLNGALVFTKGDVLKVHLPKPMDKDIKVKAVSGKKDRDICYDCCFFSMCRQYAGIGPLGSHCYTTVFQVCED